MADKKSRCVGSTDYGLLCKSKRPGGSKRGKLHIYMPRGIKKADLGCIRLVVDEVRWILSPNM